MLLKTIKVGRLEENCYIISSSKAIIVDPGDEGNKIIKYLEKNNLDLEAILITHYHFDHVTALKSILEYKNVKVYDYKLDEGTIKIGDFDIEVIKTPGHTNDSVTYYFKDYNLMFTGDFIFKGNVGRWDLGGSLVDLKESLIKISKYDGNIVLYPGHGNKTILAKEIINAKKIIK